MTAFQKKLATLGAILSMLLGIVDANIVASAAWPIARSLDPANGLDSLPWLITAYGLAATVTQPLYGKLCDLYGAKKVYLFALAVFLGGSALCGLAADMSWLIAFRALQGVGGGGLMSVTLVVVLTIWPPDELKAAGGGAEGGGKRGGGGGVGAGMGGIMTGLGIVIGPLAGGLITDHWSWRWIFYINLPLGVIAFCLAAFALKLPVRTSEQRIDFLGAGLVAGAASVLLLVTEWGGKDYAWGSGTILGLGALGVLLLVIFLFRQGLVPRGALGRFTAPEPIFPLALFRDPVFRIAGPQQFISGMVTVGTVVYVSLYLQSAQGVRPTQAGLHLLPMALGMTIASIAAGRVISRWNRFRPVLTAGMVLVTCALFLLSTLDADTPTWVVNLYLFLLGAGLGQVLGLALIAVQIAVPREHVGVAITGVRFVQTLGGAVGSAVFGTILAREFNANLPPGGGGGGGAERTAVTQLSTLPVETREIVINALVKATDAVFLQASFIAVVAVIITLFFREPVPARDFSDEQAVPISVKRPEKEADV